MEGDSTTLRYFFATWRAIRPNISVCSSGFGALGLFLELALLNMTYPRTVIWQRLKNLQWQLRTNLALSAIVS
jgi:hypothetical protein